MRGIPPKSSRYLWLQRARSVALRLAVCVSLTAAAWGVLQAWPHSAAQFGSQVGTRVEDELKQLLVKVDSTLAGASFSGAGIVIGGASDRLYVMTVNHLVRRGELQADRVYVRFKWLPGEPREAQVLEHADDELDLAVLAVTPARELSVPKLAWNVLSSPTTLAPTGTVVPIGVTPDAGWSSHGRPHQVTKVTGQQIVTKGESFPGSVGGPLITKEGHIVGLVSRSNETVTESSRIDVVTEKLVKWGYPVQLQSSSRKKGFGLGGLSGRITSGKQTQATSASGGTSAQAMPQFPWPPPAWSLRSVLKSGLVVQSEGESLGTIFDRLRSVLNRAGIDYTSVFAVGTDGFAVVSRPESITDDGRPTMPRWPASPVRLRTFSLSEYIRALFTAAPGRYRVIVFVVTDRSVSAAGQTVDRARMEQLMHEGAGDLSSVLRRTALPPNGRCEALIYEFYRPSADDQATLVTRSQLSVLQHLVGAGLWSAQDFLR